MDKQRLFSEIEKAAAKSGLDFREAMIALRSCRSLLSEYAGLLVDPAAAGREVSQRTKRLMKEDKLGMKAAMKQVLSDDPILAELYRTAPRTHVEC